MLITDDKNTGPAEVLLRHADIFSLIMILMKMIKSSLKNTYNFYLVPLTRL